MNDSTNDIWRDIDGFPGYRVQRDGTVWSCWQKPWPAAPAEITKHWRKLKAGPDAYGYPVVTLCRDGKKHHRKVHRLILQAFIGSCPDKQEACHNDGNRANNNLSNLRWASHKDNLSDQELHGTKNIGERNGSAKLTIEKVKAIREQHASGVRQSLIAKSFGISSHIVSNVVLRKNWTHHSLETMK